MNRRMHRRIGSHVLRVDAPRLATVTLLVALACDDTTTPPSAHAGNAGTADTFVVEDGHVRACHWSGDVWLSAGPDSDGVNGTRSSIAAESLARAPLCASGTVAAREDYGSWAILGYNVAQAEGGPALEATPRGDGLYVRVQNRSGGELRVQTQDAVGRAGGPDSPNHRWCKTLSLEEELIPWEAFNTHCWDPAAGTAYAKTPLESVMILVPSPNAVDREFDFCVEALADATGECGAESP